MKRSEIIKEVLDCFFNDMVSSMVEIGFEDFDANQMKKYMIMFFVHEAKGLSDRELLTAFGDPGQVLDKYIEFLTALLERCGKSLQ